MGKKSLFKYSKEENKINKVLKMNLDTSSPMQNDSEMKALRKEADDNIKSSYKLLEAMGKKADIQKLTNISEKSSGENPQKKLKLETWEEIAAQAELIEPKTVVLEDFMSVSEIRSAFNELEKINKEFSKKTGIVNKTDLSFLAIATALQVTKSLVFPYIAKKFDYGKSFDPSKRLDHNDKSIKDAQRKSNDGFRDRHMENHGKGHWINILYQTVPYDITKGSNALSINMGGRYHRMYTLGHDPILGWIFGTANILTDCITFNNFHTNRVSRIDPITGGKKMVITPEIIPMGMMFKECYDEVKADFLNLPAALFAQAQHLKSDEFTKLGLPVPMLSTINENFASKLYSENYDALCFSRDAKIIGASFVVSKLVDIIIALTHGLFRKKNEDKDLYEVKTRKILLISNSIASTSTIINTAVTKNPKNLDIGSLMNLVTHLFFDVRFMAKIKQEFIENKISNKLQKDLAEIDDMFEKY